MLHAYLIEFGDELLSEIIGPFAFVFFSPENNQVLAARDSMGGRYLSYALTEKALSISSFDMALAAHPDVGYRLDEEKRIRLLCNIMEDQPSSTINGVTPICPGEKLEYSDQTLDKNIFYLPNPRRRIRLAENCDYAKEFRRLLAQAVSRRLRSLYAPGVMLSGGMDSVPIALAAQQQLNQQDKQLKAFSWIFDSFPEADEREISSWVCKKFGLDHQLIQCDNIWPSFDNSAYLNPVLPYISPYSEFNRCLFAEAQKQRVGILLSGIGGDMLYTGTPRIVVELLRGGRFHDAWREARCLLALHESGWQFAKRILLEPASWVQMLFKHRRKRASSQPDFLTSSARAKFSLNDHWLQDRSPLALRPEQYRSVVDAFEGEDANYGKYMEVTYQLERRYPMRDRELVEFMLAIPTQQLYSLGVHRPIVKRAFYQEFDQRLNQRNDKTDFSSVIQAGVASDQAHLGWLNRPEARWRADVKDCYLMSENAQKSNRDAVQWRCAYHEYWLDACYNLRAKELGLYNE